MPTFYTIEGIRILLYFNDHNPPHFHAMFAEYEVLIHIHTLEVLRGTMPRNKLRIVLNWAGKNQTNLIEIWNNLRNA